MTEVAYFNTEYPSLTHTFIEREVRSVRAHGVRVHTYSLRRPDAVNQIGSAHASALEETEVVSGGWLHLAGTALVALLTNPAGLLRSAAAAQRLSPGGLRWRARHAAYTIQGARLARLLARRGLRHVHVHMANNGAMVALLACRFDRRLRYSMTIHGSAEFFDVHQLRLGAKAEGAAFVRCISKFCAAQVMAWSEPSHWSRVHMVHTGVDPQDFAPPGSRPQDRLRLVSVGRMVPIKGYDVLLEACARLSAQGTEWSLEMIGDGPLMAPLQEKARSLGIADRVAFAGRISQDELRGHLDRANVMVVSSFMEGVPVVLMEAMATGMAVVATKVGGVGELVEHERTGLLADPASAADLAGAIARLASDSALRASLGAAARARVVEQFAIADAGAAMTRLFATYAGSPGTP